MTKYDYVHGYTKRESLRLEDQANTLDDILHHDTIFPAGSRILEAGCGNGAQTKIIAKKNPGSHFIAMIEGIKEKAIKKGIIDEDTFNKGIEDLYRTTFKDGVFCYTFFKGIGYK